MLVLKDPREAERRGKRRRAGLETRPQTPREWERWLAATRKTIVKIVIREDGKPGDNEPRLIHAHRGNGGGRELLPAHEPEGLA